MYPTGVNGTAHPLDVVAHMPGQHDQANHGNRRNGGRTPLPTRTKGYVDDPTFDGILADVLEHVGDVAWPTSIRTYQQMRRDPKLTALLDGYKLQLLRAQWQVDGTGCRPEVVQLVADDLGLPVKGSDQHGAARTRGVSWFAHLRSALTMLDFGHMGFEMQAQVAERQARLVGLWERPQHTLSQIHVKPTTGEFNGISQELDVGRFDHPEIGPDRIVWYAHKREGAQWFGLSLIRPAYPPWLLKREMQRVLATSSRRFGMGVPTAEFADSATPTPQQFSEAQKAAAAARVGDQAGLAMPPGAALKLVGLSGGTPDTLAFIKWLDQQMSVSALMGHLDLGQTETGSRALGSVFVDSLMLALESLGEQIADEATRQIAARIVAWNWGRDEPVPQVAVSGIGSRREVTAESMQMLLDSGALSADPGLEEWVRREYRLPPDTGERKPAPSEGKSAGSGAGPAQAAQAAGRQPVEATVAAVDSQPADPTPQPRPEQPVLFEVDAQAAEEPTAEEQQAGTDPQELAGDHQEALAALLLAWPLLAAPLAAALAAGAGTAAVAGSLGAAGALAVPASVVDDIASAATQTMASLWTVSAERAQAEVASQGVDVDLPAADMAQLRQHAAAVADVLVSGYRSAATRAALNAAGLDADADEVQRRVQARLQELTDTASGAGGRRGRGFVAGELSALLHTAAHFGRVAVFGTLQGVGAPVVWVASETNDAAACQPCRSIDGHQFDTLRAALAAYPTGKYTECLGRQNCRGYLYARINRGDDRVQARARDEAVRPRDHRGRFRRVLSMDMAGDVDITAMSDGRLQRQFAESLAESPPDETALLKVNAELERRERAAAPAAADVEATHWRDQPRWPEDTPGGLGGQWRGDQTPGLPGDVQAPTVQETTYTVAGRPNWRNPQAEPPTQVRENLTIQGRVTNRDKSLATITGSDGQHVRVFDTRGQAPLGATVRLETADRQGNWAGIHSVRHNQHVEVLEPPPPRETPAEPGGVTPLADIANMADLISTVEAVNRADQEDDSDTSGAVGEIQSAMNELFQGQFAGLLTEAEDVRLDGDELEVTGRITTSDGIRVGGFRRFYRRDSLYGGLTAHHAHLQLDPGYQGSGFAREFNDHLMGWYGQARDQVRVSLTANIDVGGYAWARDGYEFADDEGFGKVMGRLLQAVGRYEDRMNDSDAPPQIRQQIEAAWQLLQRAGVDRFDPDSQDVDRQMWDQPEFQPWHISELGRPDGGGRGVEWVGKEALLGSEWRGQKWA